MIARYWDDEGISRTAVIYNIHKRVETPLPFMVTPNMNSNIMLLGEDKMGKVTNQEGPFNLMLYGVMKPIQGMIAVICGFATSQKLHTPHSRRKGDSHK